MDLIPDWSIAEWLGAILAAFASVTSILVGLLHFKKPKADIPKLSEGGSAIRAGEGSKLNVDNFGEIAGGRSGIGGAGGDAISVGAGVPIKIVNHGKILGGDAREDCK